MRLIDADALMELARNHVNRTVDCNDIARFLTIDAVPVVHGKWLPVSVDPADPYFRCSVCHYGTDTIFDGGEEPFKYCPNCGARMDAKE